MIVLALLQGHIGDPSFLIVINDGSTTLHYIYNDSKHSTLSVVLDDVLSISWY